MVDGKTSPMTPDAGSARTPVTWRVTIAGRVCAAVAALVYVVLGVSMATDGEWEAFKILPISTAVIAALLAWACAFRPRLSVLEDGTVVVVNPWWTHRFAIADVEEARPAYDGLVITRRNRRRVHVWAVQESNFKKFTRRPSRAKNVAREIERRAGLSRQESIEPSDA